MNFLEDTFFHHSFVVQSIGEPRDQSRCLVLGPSKTKEPGSPSQRQLLSCELQNRFAAKVEGEGIEREWEKQREGTDREDLEHTSGRVKKEKIQVVEERHEKRNLHPGGAGEWGRSTVPGSERALSSNEIKQNNNKKKGIIFGGISLEPEIQPWVDNVPGGI